VTEELIVTLEAFNVATAKQNALLELNEMSNLYNDQWTVMEDTSIDPYVAEVIEIREIKVE
jgi:hypothetical protein